MDDGQATERSRPVCCRPAGLASSTRNTKHLVGKLDKVLQYTQRCLSEKTKHFQSQFYFFGVTTSRSARGPSASISLVALIANHCNSNYLMVCSNPGLFAKTTVKWISQCQLWFWSRCLLRQTHSKGQTAIWECFPSSSGAKWKPVLWKWPCPCMKQYQVFGSNASFQ